MMLKKAQKKSIPEVPSNPIGFIWYLLQRNKALLLVSVLVVTTAQILITSTPYIFRSIVDAAEGVATGTSTAGTVWFWALAFPVVLTVTFILWRISGFTGMQWMTRVNADSYDVLFRHLGKHSHTYFSDRFAGSLSSKVTHASEGAQSLLEATLWNWYPGILSLIITFFYIANLNIIASIIFAGLIAILVPLNIRLAKYRRPHVVAFASQATRTRGRLVDALTNIGAVRQYARQSFEEASFVREVETLRALNIKQWGISEWGLVLNNVLIVLFELILVVMVVTLWSKGQISTGELVMAITLLMNINDTLTFIGSSINSFIRRYADVEEGLQDVLKAPEITDISNAKKLQVTEGSVVWENVNFDYGNSTVFKNFTLNITPGQRVGLVGHSGAGKTTFVSLLLRQHDLTSGEICIDGQDIKKITQESLRKHIAVVPQEPLLFHRTIRENIAYGKPDATDEEIIEVAKKAQAHEFISTLSKGYDTLVGERGIKLSGGQKQRVAIARAMLKDAPILVLDEATSALDSESEVLIQKALEELMKGRTVIAIAHRLSTLRKMDRIIVLEKGSITEDGTHDSLAGAGGIYQRLWDHQAGGFLVE